VGVTPETCRAKKLSDIKYLRLLHQVGVFIYFNGKYCNKVAMRNLVSVVTVANQSNEAGNGYFNSEGNLVKNIK
jgi:hypothetical protein